MTIHRIDIEVEAEGDVSAFRTVVLRHMDNLMQSLLAAPDVRDPSIGTTFRVKP